MPLFGIVALSERGDNLNYYRLCGMLSDSQLGAFHLMKTLSMSFRFSGHPWSCVGSGGWRICMQEAETQVTRNTQSGANFILYCNSANSGVLG